MVFRFPENLVSKLPLELMGCQCKLLLHGSWIDLVLLIVEHVLEL